MLHMGEDKRQKTDDWSTDTPARTGPEVKLSLCPRCSCYRGQGLRQRGQPRQLFTLTDYGSCLYVLRLYVKITGYGDKRNMFSDSVSIYFGQGHYR